MCAWLHMPFLPNHIYTDLPPPLWSSSSELSERLSPRLWSSVNPQIKLKLTALMLCVFICQQFRWPRKDPEQTSLLHLNSVRIQSLGTIKGPLVPSRGPCSHLLPHWGQVNLGESLLVLRLPEYWLMILSFIWQWITGT